MRLFPRRQLESLAQIRCALINKEAWRYGRYFEQDSARLAEIDGLEVAAIHHRRHAQSTLQEILAQRQLLFGRRDGECDMVHGAQSVRRSRRVGIVLNVDEMPWCVATGSDADAA